MRGSYQLPHDWKAPWGTWSRVKSQSYTVPPEHLSSLRTCATALIELWVGSVKDVNSL